MQCSRCQSSGYRERRVVRRPKLPAHLIPELQFDFDEARLTDSDFGESSNSDDLGNTAFTKHNLSEFIATYRGALIISFTVALFCAAALYHLSLSVLHLGVAAIPFLGLFVTGFFVSAALPFKFYKEFKAFNSLK